MLVVPILSHRSLAFGFVAPYAFWCVGNMSGMLSAYFRGDSRGVVLGNVLEGFVGLMAWFSGRSLGTMF